VESKKAVKWMMEKLQESCDDSCTGTTADLLSLQQTMIGDTAASHVADLFKALSDPTRVKLIYAMLGNELCVHDLSQLLQMGQSAISHQLRYLRNLRIVKRRKSGKTVFYSLDDDHIEQIFVQTLQHMKHE
jgi:DNA-binding transcriptional ArsR family regulator